LFSTPAAVAPGPGADHADVSLYDSHVASLSRQGTVKFSGLPAIHANFPGPRGAGVVELFATPPLRVIAYAG